MKEALNDHFVPDTECLAERLQGSSRDIRTQRAKQMRTLLQLLLNKRFIRRPLSWLGTGLGIVWASPLTAFGLLLALPVIVYRGEARLVRGPTPAILARGPFADAMLSRHPFGVMNAMALGHVVIAMHDGLSPRVLMHELAHVRQAACWGIVFPFAYLASSAWAALRGKDAYWHNRFEIAARKAEKHI